MNSANFPGFKFKKIIIVHSGVGLASDAMGHKFQEKIKSICERLEIELRLGEWVTNLEEVLPNRCFSGFTIRFRSRPSQ